MCLMNYFRLIYKRCEEDENYFDYASKFSMQRNCPEPMPIDEWYSSEKRLRSIQILPTGSMEDCPYTSIKADFANEFLGGGVFVKQRLCDIFMTSFVDWPTRVLHR